MKNLLIMHYGVTQKTHFTKNQNIYYNLKQTRTNMVRIDHIRNFCHLCKYRIQY